MDSFTITITLTYEEVMPNYASPQYFAPSIVDIPESSYAEEVDRPSDNDENVSLDDENNISHLEDDGQIQSLPQGETDCDDSVVPLDHRNRTTMVVGHHDYHASTSNPCHESIIAKKKRARAMGAAASAAVPDYGGGCDDFVVSSDHRNETTVLVAQPQDPDPGARRGDEAAVENEEKKEGAGEADLEWRKEARAMSVPATAKLDSGGVRDEPKP
ncbi:hypothetical protein ACFX13_029503 [Malus domestica]